MIRTRPADYFAVFISIAAAAAMAFLVYSGYSAPSSLEITLPGSIEIYMLDTDRTISAEGPLGSSVIIIKDSKAYFESSPCPDKLCVKAGCIHDTGEWTGCLPNRVFIRITGGEVKETDEEVDSISY